MGSAHIWALLLYCKQWTVYFRLMLQYMYFVCFFNIFTWTTTQQPIGIIYPWVRGVLGENLVCPGPCGPRHSRPAACLSCCEMQTQWLQAVWQASWTRWCPFEVCTGKGVLCKCGGLCGLEGGPSKWQPPYTRISQSETGNLLKGNTAPCFLSTMQHAPP